MGYSFLVLSEAIEMIWKYGKDTGRRSAPGGSDDSVKARCQLSRSERGVSELEASRSDLSLL